MRYILLPLLAFALSPVCAQTVATYQFEQGLNGFACATPAQVTHETAHPLVGAGALRMTLPEKVGDLRVTSPEFPVQPWTLYRVRVRQNTDLGAEVRFGVEMNYGEGWRTGSYYVIPDGSGTGLFGTFPDTTKARLFYTLLVPGQALGRSAVLDEIRVSQEKPLVKEAGANLYWDGGFEVDKSDMSFWTREPKKVELSTDRPHGGRQCLHVESDPTILVWTGEPVQPGRLYRFRCWVRGGPGEAAVGMHKLAPSDWQSMRADTAVRVGWGGPAGPNLKLQPDTWQLLEIVTPCESDRIVWFNAYLWFSGGWVDVDDAELVSIAE